MLKKNLLVKNFVKLLLEIIFSENILYYDLPIN